MKIAIANARLAFPNLFRPRPGKDGGKAKYGASLIIPPNHPAVAQINAACEAVAKEKWGAKAPQILEGLKKQDKLCIHDGVTKAEYDGFTGNFYVSANSDARPLVINRDKSALAESDGKPYAGCYVNANIEVWAQDHKEHGKRINAQLRGVQFVKDGDAFSAGSPASEDEFADLSEEAEVDPTA
jgi:hypothetical protein